MLGILHKYFYHLTPTYLLVQHAENVNTFGQMKKKGEHFVKTNPGVKSRLMYCWYEGDKAWIWYIKHITNKIYILLPTIKVLN